MSKVTELNSQPVDDKSDALTTTLHHQATCYTINTVELLNVLQTLVQIQKFKKHLTGIKIRYTD